MLRWIDVLYYARYSNPEPLRRVEKSEAEWKMELSTQAYQILREKGTEKAFRNAYCRWYEPGMYVCRACGQALFESGSKNKTAGGWPSFSQPIAKAALQYAFDDSHHMKRIEVLCNICDGHLGHVFPDGPEPSGLRYCINSESLQHLPTPELPTETLP